VGASVAATLFVGPGVASAEYRQQEPIVEINPSRTSPGGTLTATIHVTCVDGSSIGFQIEPAGDSNAAICTVDTYAARLTAPSKPGTYHVLASGITAQPATLTVATASGSTEQPLPSTGPRDATSIALLAAALLGGGAALVRLSRFRHRPGD
jgi:LPXTG-motif cell wall-anchored protein